MVLTWFFFVKWEYVSFSYLVFFVVPLHFSSVRLRLVLSLEQAIFFWLKLLKKIALGIFSKKSPKIICNSYLLEVAFF